MLLTGRCFVPDGMVGRGAAVDWDTRHKPVDVGRGVCGVHGAGEGGVLAGKNGENI